MTWIAVLVAAAVAGVLGGLTPRAIAALPEPAPVDPEEADQYYGPRKESDAPPKPLYADLARGSAPLLAALSGGAAAVMALGTGWDARLLPLVVVAPAWAALAYVDARTRLLPVRLHYPALAATAVAVLAAALLAADAAIALRGAIGGLAAWALFHVLCLVFPRGMGYGDVRLAGLIGLALTPVGYAEVGFALYGAFLLGGVGGLLLSVLRLANRKRTPFGPWMLLAAVLAVPLGEPLAAALLGV